MAQHLRAFAALGGVQGGSVPSIHTQQFIITYNLLGGAE